jgi:hypothetical protein
MKKLTREIKFTSFSNFTIFSFYNCNDLKIDLIASIVPSPNERLAEDSDSNPISLTLKNIS